MFRSSRGLAQMISCLSNAEHNATAADIIGTGSRPVSAIRPANTETFDGAWFSNAPLTSRTCSIVKITVRGATLCPVEPVNTKTTTFKLVCKQTGGKQEFTEYENEAGEKFTAITESKKGSGSFEESGLQGTETLTFGELAEIKVT